MKDVPSTERMVLCSQQWKLLSQKEKDAYHKKCDQVSCAEEDFRRRVGLALGVEAGDLTPARVSRLLGKRMSGPCSKLGGVLGLAPGLLKADGLRPRVYGP